MHSYSCTFCTDTHNECGYQYIYGSGHIPRWLLMQGRSSKLVRGESTVQAPASVFYPFQKCPQWPNIYVYTKVSVSERGITLPGHSEGSVAAMTAYTACNNSHYKQVAYSPWRWLSGPPPFTDTDYVIIYDIFNCNWVATWWQQYSTHIHTNNTQNDTKQTIHTTQKLGRVWAMPRLLRVLPRHLPYNRGKSMGKPRSG
jgi:hypothetical protein